ncbi:MAG: type II toxin-antitoxin system HicB family antitoxin [Stackebrandtia sp.]
MKIFDAIAEHVDGWWAVSVPQLPGVYTQGRTWSQAHDMARDAVALILDIPPDKVEVHLTPRLPGHAEEVLDELAEARSKKSRAVAEESERLRAAAKRLIDARVSVRDAGAILGISYQRVSQLTAKGPKAA